MARIVGIQNSNFDTKRLKRTFSQNSGKNISTEDIKEGWDKLKSDISETMVDNLKKSPYFIEAKNV